MIISSNISILSNYHYAETLFFPMVEKAIKVPGFMEVNVDQHKLFDEGITKFENYLLRCQGKFEKTYNKESAAMQSKEEFSADKLQALIDSFADVLTTHLSEEIDTLLALEEYDIDIMQI